MLMEDGTLLMGGDSTIIGEDLKVLYPNIEMLNGSIGQLRKIKCNYMPLMLMIAHWIDSLKF